MGVLYSDARIIEPMKINKIPEGKEHMFPSICESGEYFAQLKKDGYWYMYEKTANNAYLFSRNKSVETGTLTEKGANVPHIMDTLSILPKDTILIGEIYYPNKRSKDVTPIMGSLPEKAIERQKNEYGFLHYYIHDILYYQGVELYNYGASIRYNILKKVFEKWKLGRNQYIELAERVDENIQEFVADALEKGEEGAVLKKKTAPYTPGKRPAWDTIKIKKTDTCDAICIGFSDPTKYYNGKLDVGINYSGKEAKNWAYWIVEQRKSLDSDIIIDEYTVPIGETIVIKSPLCRTCPVTKAYYYGWKTSMEIGAYDDNGHIVSIGFVSSGLTEQMQEIAGSHPENFIGKVVKLAGMEKDYKAKTLRHFYFKDFHEDKNPEDCTLKEIFLTF